MSKKMSVKKEQVGGKAHEGAGVRNNGEGKNADKENVGTPTFLQHLSHSGYGNPRSQITMLRFTSSLNK